MVLSLVCALGASADTKYWDIDGATAGAGGATPAGTWDTATSNWTTDSTGASAGTTWVAGDTAVFAAGTNATGAYTVTISGTQSVGAITVEEGTITQGTGTVDFGATNGVFTVASGATWSNSGAGTGTITGTNGITMSASSGSTGVLKLGGANTFTKAGGAALTINGGIVEFTGDAGLGSVPGASTASAVTINGGTLRYTSTTSTTLNVNRGITIGTNGGTIEVTSAASTGLSLPSAAAFTLNGSGTLTKTGAGRFTLNTTSNSFTGKYIVKAGSVSFGGDGRFGLAPASPSADYFTLDGGGLRYALTGNTTLNANRGITLGANGGYLAMPGGAGGILTYNGIIAGTLGGAFTAASNDGFGTFNLGTIQLGGANTYNGETRIAAQTTLQLGAAGVIPNASVVNFLGTNSVLNLNSFSETVKAVSGTAGSISLGTATLTLDNPAGESFSGPIGGSGGVTKNGAGIQTLAGTNNYTGATTINAGTLRLGANNVIPDASAVILANTATAVLDVNGKTETIASLSGGGATGGNVALGAGDLSVGDANSTVYSGSIGGTGTVTKQGTGTLTLAGTSTYSGDTTVSAGTLRVNGSVTGGGNFAVTANGTLAGIGAITGLVAVNNNGTLSPGDSSGPAIQSLDTGKLTFNSGSIFDYQIDSNASLAAAADLVNVSGDLTILAGATLSFSYAGTNQLAKLTLISYSGNLIGPGFTGYSDGSIVVFGANQYTINYNDTMPGENGGAFGKYVTLTAVPEASTILFGGLVCVVGGLIHGGRRWLKAKT
ncbi:MAG: autotransporter-associated beta strand repeat-containing protein [Pirellulales bacterium]